MQRSIRSYSPLIGMFAAVLYAVLFFGVYSPLFGLELATAQLVGFFSIPAVVTGLIVAAVLTHDWSDVVHKRLCLLVILISEQSEWFFHWY